MFSAMTWMKKHWGSNKEAAGMALKVTSAQLKAIFALSRKLGMDMEDLHGMAYRISGHGQPAHPVRQGSRADD